MLNSVKLLIKKSAFSSKIGKWIPLLENKPSLQSYSKWPLKFCKSSILVIVATNFNWPFCTTSVYWAAKLIIFSTLLSIILILLVRKTNQLFGL